jgi:ABC-2 type transport system ATP-binding protein
VEAVFKVKDFLKLDGKFKSFKNKNKMEIQNLSYTVNKKTILENINVFFVKGMIHSIMSPSGFGKSTLLKCISGRYKHSATIQLDNKPFKGCGYMNQELYMMDSLTVLQTIQFYHNCSTKEKYSHDFYKNYLESFGLQENILNRVIGDNIIGGISGGEKKRLMLACHLLRNLPVLILDEPLTGLDEATGNKIYNLLEQHVQQHQNVCIISLHNPGTQIQTKLKSIFMLNKNLSQQSPISIELKELTKSEYFDIALKEEDEYKSNNSLITIDSFSEDIETMNINPSYSKLLFYRELSLIRKDKAMILGRFAVVFIISCLQSLIIGYHGYFTDKIVHSINYFEQLNYFIHLIICYFTCSMFPMLFIEQFFKSLQIVRNEIDQGWYPFFHIFHIKLLMESIIVVFLSIVYSIITYMPFIYYSSLFWVYFLNVFFTMFFITLLLFLLSLTNQSTLTLGGTVLYNSFSFLFNIGYLIKYHNKFTGIVQVLSLMHLQSNSNILSIAEYNPSISWLVKQINIAQNYPHWTEPLLITLGYIGIGLVTYYFVINR